eukprot:Pgem_evm1s10300
MPDELFLLVNLEELTFCDNGIVKLDNSIAHLSKLERLNLSQNSLEEVPEEI